MNWPWFGGLPGPASPAIPAQAPAGRPANWAAARTCLACTVDWHSLDPCFCCGAAGIALSALPAAAQTAHHMAGQAVMCPSTTTESSPT